MFDLLQNVWETFYFFKFMFLKKNDESEKIEGHFPQSPPCPLYCWEGYWFEIFLKLIYIEPF